MRVQEDRTGERLRFGAAPSRRLWGLAVALSGPALSLFLSKLGLALPVGYLWAICGITTAIGYWIAFDSNGIELNPESGSYAQIRGPWPFTRRSKRALSEFDRLVLEVTPEIDVFGEERQMRSLFLEGNSARLTLFLKAEGMEAVKRAETLAAALGWPPPAEVMVSRSRRPFLQRGITFGTWGVMLALVVFLVWPARSTPRQRSAARYSMPPILQHEGDAESHYRQGTTFYFQSQFKEAEQELRRALELAPGSARYLNMLAYALAEQDRLQDALRVAQTALNAAPQDWMIIDTVAEMHQRRKEWATAAAFYERALQAAPRGDVSETQCKYGETLIELGRKREATQQLVRASAGRERYWVRRARQALARIGVDPPSGVPPTDSPMKGTTRSRGRGMWMLVD